MVVSQQTAKISSPKPATKAATATAAAQLPAARAARAAARSGASRRSPPAASAAAWMRSISRPPRSVRRLGGEDQAPSAAPGRSARSPAPARAPERPVRMRRSRSRTAARSTTATSRERKAAQPSASSRTKFGVCSRTTSGRLSIADEERAAPKLAASIAIAQPGPGRGDQDAAERGAEHVGGVQRQPQQRVRLLDHGSGTVCGTIPCGRGEEKRGHGAVQRAEHDELPDLGAAGEQERRDRALRGHAGHVRADHDHVARQPVGDHAAEKDEDCVRDRARGEDEAEFGPRSVQVSSTAKASPIGAIALPMNDEARAAHSRRKRRSPNGPSLRR